MEEKEVNAGCINTTNCQEFTRDDDITNSINETINESKYTKLLDGIRSRIFDLVDSITDDYLDNLTDTIDDEIRNIKENNKYLREENYKYRVALRRACEELLRRDGWTSAQEDFIEKRIELENKFLEKGE